VKEVRPSANGLHGIDAYAHLRYDLSDLRKKFGPSRPQTPVLLVSINFSGHLFTGFSVARAMLGDVGAEFSADGRGTFHHVRRGNASMTSVHHTLISGIFVFDYIEVFYNRTRRHSFLGGISPEAFEHASF
jgi:hypothetical protein